MRDPQDKRHFADMMQGLSVAVKGGEVTRGVLLVYFQSLQDLTLVEFDRAIGRASQECDWFPSVNELRAFAGCKRAGPVPLHLRPVEDELERIETCQFHIDRGAKARSPGFVAWCRKCRRHAALGAPRGEPAALGDMLRLMGVAGEKEP